MDILKSFRKENHYYISKGIGEVSTEVLISMVETLIWSTSLKRKFDSHLDSVGGDIDIITITKGNGLIYKSKIDPTIK